MIAKVIVICGALSGVDCGDLQFKELERHLLRGEYKQAENICKSVGRFDDKRFAVICEPILKR